MSLKWLSRGHMRGDRPARTAGAVREAAAGRVWGSPLGAVCCALALTALTLQLAAPGARAQEDVSPEDVAAIARDLNCPICRGYTLQECPLPVCGQMRDLIRERLAEGKTREEIIDLFVAEYGPEVLNAPPREGFFAVAWVLPVAALLAAAFAVATVVRRSSRRLSSPGTAAAGAQPDPRYVARLERLAAGVGGGDEDSAAQSTTQDGGRGPDRA